MKETDLLPLEKKYIEVQYDPVTQGYLREYCEENGFDLSTKFNGTKQDPEDFDFHSTVWFTTTEHRLQNQSLGCDVSATATGFALFGEKENILVLEISSNDLTDIRNQYGTEYEMEDEWPEYRPHITLCYDWDGSLPDVPLPEEQLVAKTLNIKKQISF